MTNKSNDLDNAPSGEWDTFLVRRSWIAARPDGRKALVLETVQGRVVAFELPQEVVQKMAADLAKLSALTPPPSKPSA